MPVAADPFADAERDEDSGGGNSKDYVHIRIQQRNGKKSLTTVQVKSQGWCHVQGEAANARRLGAAQAASGGLLAVLEHHYKAGKAGSLH